MIAPKPSSISKFKFFLENGYEKVDIQWWPNSHENMLPTAKSMKRNLRSFLQRQNKTSNRRCMVPVYDLWVYGRYRAIIYTWVDVSGLAWAVPPDDDDVYLRLQNGKGLHNLVYVSYVKHINPACKS
jgi:hypothetical protein